MNYKLFKKQVEALLPDVKKFSYSLARNSDNSNDLAQQSLVRALSKADQFKDNSNLKSWLFRIVYTTWIDITRKNKTITNYKNTIHENHPVNYDNRHNISSLNTYIDCKKMLILLADKQKASFHLVCLEGYTYSEAAKILGIPIGTVASRVTLVRRTFNQYFSKKKRPGKTKWRKLI
ncbi:MAG: RNA polymerase sigma factor [Deltaproteobacteria bacterium]|jgi:RNA polymerase sigma-70 factor (ECF subfamily)|nr:RNA polymerase sigma factor [Deltaproteobacteria bacterium]